MSIFNELLPQVLEISKSSVKNSNDQLQAALKYLDKLTDEYQNGRGRAREKAVSAKTRLTALQSINEDERESPTAKDVISSATENKPRRVSKKRSKDEVEGMSSPETDKRQKRNASVRAQNNISKQRKEPLQTLNDSEVEIITSNNLVNVNLVQKLRRENSTEKSRGRRRKDYDKENEPLPLVQIKQEKVSLPPEPMETSSLPIEVVVKQEPVPDQLAMPPPTAPVPKPRKGITKNKSEDSSEEESGSGRKRNTRTKKADADVMPPPPVPIPSARSTRASSRASSRSSSRLQQVDRDESTPAPAPALDTEPLLKERPKRTRAKKKVSTSSTESEKETAPQPEENVLASPIEKRPKRTKRGQKAAEKDQQKPVEEPKTISPKEERISVPEPTSPILKVKEKSKTNLKKSDELSDKENKEKELNKMEIKEKNLEKKELNKKELDKKELAKIELNKIDLDKKELAKIEQEKKVENSRKESKIPRQNSKEKKKNNKNDLVQKDDIALDETRVIVEKLNVTVTINNDMDKTVVLPNGVYNHAPVTPKNIRNNETVVLESCRETIVLEKHTNVNDATVVIDKDPANVTDDNSSILTEDNSTGDEKLRTPPKAPAPPAIKPTSAVKEKVQQFEELATRTTRTKTRAMAKLEDQDTQTPPDKMTKPVLTAEILNKMNNMIFNGKTHQVSSSACKPKAYLPPLPTKSQPASTSKLSSLSRHRETAEETMRREKEDARKKKEAMLEAKRELQKKKREEKMAAAAAAREAAERERKLAMQAAQRDRMEKQAHADQGKMEKLREIERKKQELARKVAETEERRKAEEAARQQRLAEDQKRAEANRKKQIEEAEAIKKEAAAAREMEKKQKEYMEKQRLKHRLENERMTPGTPISRLSPVYMLDGFEYLNSDEDEEPAPRPIPSWSTSRARKEFLLHQCEISPLHIDKLFSVRVHSPDLREIFPNIERNRLKRTSSAVWRTPPNHRQLQTLHE